MKKKNLALVLAGALLASSGFGAGAQVLSTPVKPTYQIGGGETNPEGPRGAEIADGIVLFPYANLSFGRDDNILLSNTNKRASNFTLLNPGLRLLTRGELGQFAVDYDLKRAIYNSSSDDDYRDSRLAATVDLIPASSLGFRIGGLYSLGHDPRGSTDRGVSAEPDKYDLSGANALIALGANGARGRIEVEGGSYKRHYTNNRATTFLSDRSNDAAAARFFVRIAPKTSLVFEAREDKFDYESSASIFDSKERRYLGGITWDVTAITSGTFKVGRIKKNFDNPALKDYSGTGWEGNVRWSPLSYSVIDFNTAKTFMEATGLGEFILTKRYGAVWTHGWNSRFTSALTAVRTDDAYNGFARNDKSTSVGLKLGYKFMPNLTIGGEVTHTKRDSNISVFEYKKNVYMLTIGVSL
jgi:polysaccharide biosynthesis protein VpsM